ncbi:LysM peptidoglycan-binding domain-containing protein [Arsenicicoccus sp. oral taxon 190]|uniref:LysM peptidoglycan-binding domain-containing protein n=1 Tax=Arsenicicoccus sp. oral taxon 190 TaxID=1658671 RepID=UPI00067A1766|nr:LysM peptidoglycan-binding domain-containing protein [Arsenicicoccus sp. oral taxon 190]AKT51590.1 hypothetical protein ADJ73_10295 [Arsenicicoccus sp. oral taxon 190]
MSAAAAWSDPVAPACAPGRPHLRLVPTGDDVTERARRRPRITRRGRLALTMTVLVLIALAAASAWSAWAVAAPAGPARSVTVATGESLSQIAAREMPSVRTDQAVLQLVAANHLPSDQVMAGQRLVVPAP